MNTRTRAVFLIALSAAVLVACAGEPFEYHSQNEIPKGPGVFSGESGAFTIRVPGTGGDSGAPARRPAATSAAAGRAAAGSAGSPGEPDFDEFEAFREYRRAKGGGTPDYAEFQEWLEWKAYRDKVKPKGKSW